LPTDEQLALGVQNGTVDGLTALVERHYGALIGYLYRLSGGDRLLAEDIAQEVFLQVIRAIQQYQYPRPFKPWLYAIATNLARNHYNRPDTRRTVSSDRLLSGRSVSGTSAEDAILESDEAQQVSALLAALPDHQREAVVLRYYQELSLAEIADVLGIPVGTVKSRLSLGLGRLRALMEQEDV
jgi:RNA polymerase sigma-70 factor (ECF subfamily)